MAPEPSQVALISILLPMVSGVSSHILAKVPKIGAALAKAFCILASCTTFLLVLSLAAAASRNPVDARLFTASIGSVNVDVGLHVDLLAILPALLSSLFTALALIYNVHYLSPFNRAYEVGWEFNRSYSFILLFIGAMLGTLFSNNLLSLVVFWELVSLCSYVLISFWNDDELCLRAAAKCLIMTHIGTMALLAVAIIIFFSTGTLEILQIGKGISLGYPLISIVFLLMLVAILPKTVLFPLHTWLPDGTIAPTSATVIFHVCGFQSGVYIIVRFFYQVFHFHVLSAPPISLGPLFGNVSLWNFVASFIGAITLIIGGLNGLIENDLKRIVAYGTISGLGCIVMVVSLNAPLCIAAGLFLMLSHAFCFGTLFLCSGAIIHATGRHDINEMDRLYHRMPITSACCLIGVLSMLTVPLFSEFASKYLVIHSTIYAGATFSTVIALFGCILNVAVGMRLLHSFFVQTKDVTTFSGQIKDPPALMLLPMIIMSAASVIFGIFPAVPLSFLIIPAVKQMGFTVEITSQLAIIETPLGFWSPMIVATAMLALSAVFILMILHFRKGAVAGRNVEREETFQPFLCGEGSNLLDGPHGYHFYHTLTHVLRVEQLCKASNVDRAYNALSAKFLDLCAKLLRLDIRQGYFGAILSFVAGAVVALALSMVFGG